MLRLPRLVIVLSLVGLPVLAGSGGAPTSAAPADAEPELLADLWSDTEGSRPDSFVEFGDHVYFNADDGVNGSELWRLDPDTGAAELVIDLFTGSQGSSPRPQIVFGGELYFLAFTNATGNELWRTDGTSAGTAPIDLLAGSGSSSPQEFVELDGVLYFTAVDATVGRELWTWNGTNAAPVTDINPSGDSSPFGLTAVGDALYFGASDGVDGQELYRYDTVDGVTRYDLETGSTGSRPRDLIADDGGFYFRTELDGAVHFASGDPAAAVVFQELTTIPTPARRLDIGGGDLFAVVDDGALDDLFALSDPGAVAVQVMDDMSPSIGFLSSVDVGTGLVLRATTAAAGREVWFSDGTLAGTRLVRDIIAGPDSSSPFGLTLGTAGDSAIFRVTASAISSSYVWWITDGTDAGTRQLSQEVDGGSFAAVGLSGGTWAFSAATDELGEEPWLTDGTAEGTRVATDLNANTLNSFPDGFTDLGGNTTLFGASARGVSSLYVHDRSSGALGPISEVSINGAVVTVGEPATAMFAGCAAAVGCEWFRSDGTTAGTSIVADLTPGVGSTDIREPRGGDRFTYFLVRQGFQDNDLWVTELGADRTELLIDAVENQGELWGDLLVFSRRDSAGAEPWVSDGTPGGTMRLADLEPGPDGSSPSSFTVGSDGIHFTGQGRLYRTQGTAATTVEIPKPSEIDEFDEVVAVGGELLVTGESDTGDRLLLRRIGFTDDFEVIVPAAGLDIDGVELDQIVSLGDGRLASPLETDSGDGDDLVIFDGNSLTSVEFLDRESEVEEIVSYRGVAYFSAVVDDGLGDRRLELWSSDGTQAGTMRRFVAEDRDSDPRLSELTVAGDLLYFEATTVQLGSEPWTLDVGPGQPDSPAAVSASLSGERQATVSWSPPVDDGDSPIVGYAVTASPGGATCVTTGSTSCVVTGLDAGTYTFTVTASNRAKTSAPSAASSPVVVPEPEPEPGPVTPDVVSLVPGRFFDSRPGQPDFDGEGRPGQRVSAGETVRVQIAGRGEVPGDASGVVANVTAVRPASNGFITVFDCSGEAPNASSLNFRADQTVPNEIVAKLSSSGELCVFTTAELHLLVDVVGVIPVSSSVISLAPARFFDSRPNQPDFDGQGRPGQRVGAGETVRIQIAGRGGVPADASGVIANVTAVRPLANGFVTVFDCAATAPNASSLNFRVDQTVPNELVAKLSSSGELCVFTTAELHLLIDVVGAVPVGSDVVSLAPERFFDTRPNQPDFDGQGRPEAKVAAGETVRVQIAGRGEVPGSASGVIANVTAVRPSSNGFLTVFDCAGDPPNASSLNFRADQTVPNELVAKLSSGGELCVFSTSETNLLIDVVGAIT